MPEENLILIDEPAEFVRRITLNRPEKRNAISTPLRKELLAALQDADNDENVRLSIIRGAGVCFSSGYDIRAGNLMEGAPHHSSAGAGQWSRQVVESWLSIWDLAKPVIAQVHGYAMAGASELAAACDLVYIAEDAQVSHPVVRVLSPPDFNYHPWLVGFRNAMELMLTGGPISGVEAAQMGFANRAYPADELEEQVLTQAKRIAEIPADLLQINKRSVHRAMEIMGVRNAIRAMSDYQALASNLPSVKNLLASSAEDGTTSFDQIKSAASGGGKSGDDESRESETDNSEDKNEN